MLGVIGNYLEIIRYADIIIIYYAAYRLLLWAHNSHIFKLIRGILVVLSLYFITYFAHLPMLNWVIKQISTVMLLLLIIIFQPELRRFLEKIGSFGRFFSPILSGNQANHVIMIKHLLRSIDILSKEKLGALIVVEVGYNLSEYMDSGIAIKAPVSADLLATLFWHDAPTHDGAVIIRENKIEAAGCLLPLTDTRLQDRRLGTRHRAAIGLSERTDALIFVISEETGIVSLAERGNLTRYMTREAIETRLFNLYQESQHNPRTAVKNKIKSVFSRGEL